MKLAKRLLALLLAVCLFVTGTLIVSAKSEELYLADLRIVYAKDYEEALKVLQNSEFKTYSLLNYNLNATATKVDLGLVTIGDGNGVFLAYKTTTNVDEAITDIAIMQMDGGYREGNYLEMLEKSRKHYKEVGETYRTAINYMIDAYCMGDFLASCAYRQLELYYDDDHKLTLGSYFATQPGADALATIFLEGNSYAIKNIRALIGMGVSYNEDGLTYLKKVSEAAAEMDEDASIFEDEGYEDLAERIADSLITFRTMLRELSTVEGELNFEDEDFTDLELQYAEHQALAEMLRKTPYLDGKTLYDFCYNYYKDDADFSSLFPLVHALNEGQKAITTAGNYYDAVRYSMSDLPETFMNEEIMKLEETYANSPFSIYTGVDRSIYKETFALTTEAYRADVSSDKGFFESVYGSGDWKRRGLEMAAGTVGTGLFVWAIVRTKSWIGQDTIAKASQAAYSAAAKARIGLEKSIVDYANSTLILEQGGQTLTTTPAKLIKEIHELVVDPIYPLDTSTLDAATHNVFVAKVNYAQGFTGNMPPVVKDALNQMKEKTDALIAKHYSGTGYDYGSPLPDKIAATSLGSKLFTIGLYAVGAAMMAYAAYSYGSAVYSYYNPSYKDIPTAMIDLVTTEDGDRYLKYDAVTMVTMNDKKEYDAADLNAFGGQRWNALYFTKSYEAGKPLLANAASFKVVTNNNVAPKNHLAVHRFGESICYDLNKHNFDYEDSIYLSIAQSNNQKSAISKVPELIGSVFGGGLYFLVAGAGVTLGIFGTIGTQKIVKKKKGNESAEDTAQNETV